MRPSYRFRLAARKQYLAEGAVFAWMRLTQPPWCFETWLMVSIPPGRGPWPGWRMFKRHEKHLVPLAEDRHLYG